MASIFLPTTVPAEISRAFNDLSKLSPFDLSSRTPFIMIKDSDNNPVLGCSNCNHIVYENGALKGAAIKRLSATLKSEGNIPGAIQGEIEIAIPRSAINERISNGLPILYYFLRSYQELRIQFGWESHFITPNSGLGYYGGGNNVEIFVSVNDWDIVLNENGVYDITLIFYSLFERMNESFDLKELQFRPDAINERYPVTDTESDLIRNLYHGYHFTDMLLRIQKWFKSDSINSILKNIQFEFVGSKENRDRMFRLNADLYVLLDARTSTGKISFKRFMDELIASTKDTKIEWDIIAIENGPTPIHKVIIFDRADLYNIESNNTKILTINYGTANSLLKGSPSFSHEGKDIRDILAYKGLKNYAVRVDPYDIKTSKYHEQTFDRLKRAIGYAMQNSSISQSGFNKIDLNMYTSENIQDAINKVMSSEGSSKVFFEKLYSEGLIPLHRLFLGYRTSFSLYGFTGLRPFQCFNMKNTGLFDGMYTILEVNYEIDSASFTTSVDGMLVNPEPKNDDFIIFKAF